MKAMTKAAQDINAGGGAGNAPRSHNGATRSNHSTSSEPYAGVRAGRKN